MSYGTNSAWGLFPVRYMSGAAWNDQRNPYRIPSGYNTNLFKNDPATPVANGYVGIGVAGDGNVLLGAFSGFQWVDVNGIVQQGPKWVAGTVTQNGQDAIAYVADDPMIVFNVQGNGAGGAGITNSMLNRNASLIAGAGNAYSGLSGWMIDQTTVGTGATKQIKIYRIVPTTEGDNLPGVQYNNVEVLINNHYYKAGVASI